MYFKGPEWDAKTPNLMISSPQYPWAANWSFWSCVSGADSTKETAEICTGFSKALVPCMWKIDLLCKCLNKGPVQDFSLCSFSWDSHAEASLCRKCFCLPVCHLYAFYYTQGFWCKRHTRMCVPHTDCTCASSSALVKNRMTAFHCPFSWCAAAHQESAVTAFVAPGECWDG